LIISAKDLNDLFLPFSLQLLFCKKNLNDQVFIPTWNRKIIQKSIENKKLINNIMLDDGLHVSGEVYQFYDLKLYIQNVYNKLIFSVYCLRENLNQGKVTMNENHP